MSSFKNNKNQSRACPYCKKRSIPGTARNNGSQCPVCNLWLPMAIPNMVKNYAVQQRNNFRLRRVFVLSLPRDTHRWNMFYNRVLTPKPNLHIFGRQWQRYLGVDGKQPEQVNTALTQFFGAKKKMIEPPPEPVKKKKKKKKKKHKHRKRHQEESSEESPDEQENAKADDPYYQKAQEYRERAEQFWKGKPGSIGCYLSHMSMWEHIHRTSPSNEEFVLIMEDDAYFPAYGLQNVEIALGQALRYKWDIFYAGHNRLRGKQVSPLFMRPVAPRPGEKIGGFNAGFWGYVIRVSSIPKILRTVYGFESFAIDDVVRKNFDKIQALFAIPELIHHTGTWISTRERADGTLR